MLKYKYPLLKILSVGVEMTKNQTKGFWLIGFILFYFTAYVRQLYLYSVHMSVNFKRGTTNLLCALKSNITVSTVSF